MDILRPLDHVGGLLPYSLGRRQGTLYGEGGHAGQFATVYAAINAGSEEAATYNYSLIEIPVFSADTYYEGGQAVDRSELALQQQQNAWDSDWEGDILATSLTARTGKFSYEIPVTATTVAVEIHVVPFQDEPYSDLNFNVTIENNATISRTFQRSNQEPLPQIQGLTFPSVAVADGNLTLEFDLPAEYFGVSAILVTDYNGFLECTDEGICE